MKKEIERLLQNKSVSISAISKGSGVPWSTVSDLRKGESNINKMNLITAEKLYSYILRNDKMRTINLKDKIYPVDADTLLSYLAYRKILKSNAEDGMMVYDNIKTFYQDNEMAEDGISIDNDLLPALEKLASEYI